MDTQTSLVSQDLRLNVYFQNKRIREHLIQAGLINRKGVILPAATAEEIERKKRRPRIPPAISNYMVEEERKRRLFLQKYFDKAVKREKVQQIRESKHPKIRTKSLGFQDVTEQSNSRPIRARSLKRVTSSRPMELCVKNLLPPRPTTAKSQASDKNCEVTLIYYGSPKNTELKIKEADEIIVMQQHNGGENLPVFKGFVKPNQIFHFKSHRHPDYPFALAIYINGLIDTRISVCCEYKHKHNVRLGSKYGVFGIFDVQKSQPCTMCRFEKRKREILTKPTVSPYQRSGLTSTFSPNCTVRTPLVTPEKKSPKKVNRISTLAQASETSELSTSSTVDTDDDDGSKNKQNISINTEPIRKASTSDSSSSDKFHKKADFHHSSDPILSSNRNVDSATSSSTLFGDNSNSKDQNIRSRSSSSSDEIKSNSNPAQNFAHNNRRSKSPSISNNSLKLNNDKPPSRRLSTSSSSSQSLSLASIHSIKNEQREVKSRSSSNASNQIGNFTNTDNRPKSPSISNNSLKLNNDKPPSRRLSTSSSSSQSLSLASIHSNKNEQREIKSRSSSNASNPIGNFTNTDNRPKSPSISNNSWKMTDDNTIYNRHRTKTPSEKSSRPSSKTSNQSERLYQTNKKSRTPSPSSNTFKLLADLVPALPDSSASSVRSSSSASIHLPSKDNRSRSSSNSTLKQTPESPKQRKFSSSNSSIHETFNHQFSSEEPTQSNIVEKRTMSLIPLKSPTDSNDDDEEEEEKKQQIDSDDESI